MLDYIPPKAFSNSTGAISQTSQSSLSDWPGFHGKSPHEIGRLESDFFLAHIAVKECRFLNMRQIQKVCTIDPSSVIEKRLGIVAAIITITPDSLLKPLYQQETYTSRVSLQLTHITVSIHLCGPKFAPKRRPLWYTIGFGLMTVLTRGMMPRTHKAEPKSSLVNWKVLTIVLG